MKHKVPFGAILIMALALPQSVSAYDFSAVAPSGQTLYYDIVNGHAEVVSQFGNNGWSDYSWVSGDIVIPDTVYYNGYPLVVTTIQRNAFKEQSLITSAVIPNTVTSIKREAFSFCGNIAITLPPSIASIEEEAFPSESMIVYTGTIEQWCNILFSSYPFQHSSTLSDRHRLIINGEESEFAIPESVTEIPPFAFYGCYNLRSVSLPSTLTSIGEEAFAHCYKLSPLTIPSSVTSIGNNAFSQIPMVNGITNSFGARCTNGYVENNLYFTNPNKTIFVGASPNVDSIIIPGTVTEIASHALYGYDHLVYVAIPSSVTKICDNSFSGCSNLWPVFIPNSVTTIQIFAFKDVPMIFYNGTATGQAWGARAMNGYEEAGLYYTNNDKDTLVYADADLTIAEIPNSTTTVMNFAFASCHSLTTITLGSGISSLGDNAFTGCSADTLHYNATFFTGFLNNAKKYGLDSIRVVIFDGPMAVFPEYLIRGNSHLTYVNLGNSTTLVGERAFENCSSLTSVDIGSAVTSIGNNAFKGSGLRYVKIPDHVITIGERAFQECPLDSAYIGISVKYIGNHAFNQYHSVYQQYLDSSTYRPVKLIYNADSLEDYSFNTFSDIDTIIIGNNVRYIPANLFRNKHPQHLTLGNSLIQVGTAAFAQDGGGRIFQIQNEFRFPSSLKAIDDSAFYKCGDLRNLVLPDSTVHIGSNAFYDVRIWDTLFLPLLLQTIGQLAFGRSSSVILRVCVPWEYPINIRNAFSNWHLIQAFVPCYAIMNYRNDTVWNEITINGHGAGAVPVVENVVSCSPYIWRDGVSYNDGDSASFLAVYENQCDTMYTMHLRIQEPRYTSDTQYVCSNMWPRLYQIGYGDGGLFETVLDGPGHYEFHVSDIYGCDSIAGVEFIETPAYTQEDNLLLCESVFPYYYAPQDTIIERDAISAGNHDQMRFNYNTVYGCDSVFLLNLTVRQSPAADICMVTVDGLRNKLIWTQQPDAKQYNIYREGVYSGEYDIVGEVPASEMSEWIDTNSNPMSRSYRYRISTVDSCDVESEISDVHKTMHLTINRGVGNDWNLVWTEYEGAVYSSYQIYRGTSPTDIELIDQMSAGGNTTYTDHDVDMPTVYYQVAIIKDEPCVPSAKSTNIIRSNIATNGALWIDSIETEGTMIHVYPNPAHGSVSLSCKETIKEVQLIDMTGRKLTTIAPNEKKAQITLNGYLSGAYMLRITTQNSVNLKKIVIE